MVPVEDVGLARRSSSRRKNRRRRPGRRRGSLALLDEAQAQGPRSPGAISRRNGRRLGAEPGGLTASARPVDHRLVEGVLHEGGVGRAEETLQVGLVFGEEKAAAIGPVGRIEQEKRCRAWRGPPRSGPSRRQFGRTGVSSVRRPQDQVLRNQRVGRRCSGPDRAAIGGGDLDEDVVGRPWRIRFRRRSSGSRRRPPCR
jgi:hypothetical protein